MKLRESPINLMVELISKKWTFEILDALFTRQLRFSDFLDIYPDINSKILSERLKELFELGLISKVISKMAPLRFKYQITDLGLKSKKMYYEMAILGCQLFSEKVFTGKNSSKTEIERYYRKKFDL